MLKRLSRGLFATIRVGQLVGEPVKGVARLGRAGFGLARVRGGFDGIGGLRRCLGGFLGGVAGELRLAFGVRLGILGS